MNLSPKKVFLGLPVYGGYHPHFVHSLMALIANRPCELVVKPLVGDSLVARARNRLAAAFMRSDCTHLLFLDTDLIFSVDHIRRLLSHDQCVVAGLYPKKQDDLAWVCNTLPGVPPRADGLQEVRYAGTGCLLIKRSVLDRMIEMLPGIEYDPDDGDEPGVKWDFFATGVLQGKDGRRRYLSEDWYFCQRVQDLGLPVYMDTEVVLKHCGEAVYPRAPLESFADAVEG